MQQEGDHAPIGAWIVAAIVAGVWSLYLSASNKSTLTLLVKHIYPEALGQITGDVLIAAFVVWLVLYVADLRKRRPTRAGRCFVILLVVAFAIDGGGMFLLDHFASQQAAGNAVQLRLAMREVALAEIAAANPNGPALDMTIHSTGDAAVLERIGKQMASNLRNDAITYRHTLDTADYPAFLRPARLGAPGGLAKADTGLNAVRTAFDVFHGALLANLAKTRAAYASAPIDPTVRAGFLKGFDEGVADKIALRDKILQADDNILNAFQGVVSLLSHPHGRWLVEGNAMRFSDRRDIDLYNGYITKVRDTARDEQRLIAVQMKEMRDDARK